MLNYSKETGNDYTITDYLIWGGFPKLLEFSSKEDRLIYLNDIYSSIVNKDLIVRFNIKNTKLFKKITNYILRSNARIFSSRSIESYLKSEQVDGSINTIIKYVSYLEEAYIIDRIKPFSTATKKELAYYFKIYDSDVAFNSILCIDNRYDISHNLENIVYNELIYMGYEVNVFNNNNKEIDFVAFKDNKKYYIQVAYSVAEDKAYEREFRAFNNIDNNSKKILITNDEIDYSTSVIEHIKLKDFLLMNSLDD
jgi:predicted AAA+ superfamily ATPase